MTVFKNFKLLKKNMEENEWIIEAFPFKYKSNDFIVLVQLYLEGEMRPKYNLLKIEFIKNSDINESITIPVNLNGFIDLNIKKFRAFFNIEYSENQLSNIISQFQIYFSTYIPTQLNPNKSDTVKCLIVSSLSKSDSEDPDKIYCYTVARNSNRSPYNDNKTKILRHNLYRKFKDDRTISFCYKKNKIDERSDEHILLNFSERT